MSNLDDRHPILIQLPEQFHDLAAVVGVEISSRFVGEKQRGIGDDGPRHRDKLLLATATLPIESVLAQLELPSEWKERPYRDTVRQVGDAWSRQKQSLALRVPSAVCEGECNVLLNPEHPDFTKLHLDHLEPMKIDSRLRI